MTGTRHAHASVGNGTPAIAIAGRYHIGAQRDHMKEGCLRDGGMQVGWRAKPRSDAVENEGKKKGSRSADLTFIVRY